MIATATATATAAIAVATAATATATVRRSRPNVFPPLAGSPGTLRPHPPPPPAAGDRDRRDSGRDRRDSGRGSERGDRSDRSDRDRRDSGRGGPDRADERPPRPVREPSPDPVQREREEAMRSDLTVLVQRIHPRADDFEIFEFFSQVRREA